MHPVLNNVNSPGEYSGKAILSGGYMISQFSVLTISGLIMGAFIFITVVAWGEVLRVPFVRKRPDGENQEDFYNNLIYAIFLTFFTILIIYILNYVSVTYS